MFKVFSETWVAMRDFGYGNQILRFEWKKVFGHWFLAFVWVFIFWTIGAISVWTYFAPQIKGLLVKNFPDLTIELKQKQMSIVPVTPLVYGDSQNILVIDSSASASILDKYKLAVLVGRDSIWYKNEEKVLKIDYPGRDFTLSKTLLLNWISENKIKIWCGGVLLITLFTLLSTSSLAVSQVIGLFVWTFVFWLGSKFLHKKLNYFDTLKICLYASVPGIFINGFGLGNSGPLGMILPLILFAWYSGIWIYKLPDNE